MIAADGNPRFSRERFDATIARLGRPLPVAGAFDTLEAAYTQPHRAYHNVVHISECLWQLDGHRVDKDGAGADGTLIVRRDEIEAAIWFHDAVYDPRRADNESRSADLASVVLGDAFVPSVAIDRIRAMILATSHVSKPNELNGQLLVDIDLSILGRPPDVFAAYDAAIRREYSWVPDEAYRKGRAEVLRSFLGRDRIYCTEAFIEQFESAARENLMDAIARLGG